MQKKGIELGIRAPLETIQKAAAIAENSNKIGLALPQAPYVIRMYLWPVGDTLAWPLLTDWRGN